MSCRGIFQYKTLLKHSHQCIDLLNPQKEVTNQNNIAKLMGAFLEFCASKAPNTNFLPQIRQNISPFQRQVNAVTNYVIGVYCKNYVKYINTQFGYNEEFVKVR
jgi:hypothetical protein